jgi:serine O-acetyltransferase
LSQDGWNLNELVASLRNGRERSSLPLAGWHHQVQLPSGQVLGPLVESLGAALFPYRLGLPEPDRAIQGLQAATTDYFVGHTLDTCLRSLREQIRIELAARTEGSSSAAKTTGPGETGSSALALSALDRQANQITSAFASHLPRIRTLLDSDLDAAFHGDPAAQSRDEVLVCYPGVKAITYHRFAHALHSLGAPLVARIIAELSHSATGVDIHPGAVIGASFFIDHGTGVVIGGTAVIGDRVRLYQAVTLGSKSFPLDGHGHLVKGQPRHPIVEDDVVIYAGATILGRVTIGKGAQIGGNVWLTRNIAAGTTITQAKVISETFGEGGGI